MRASVRWLACGRWAARVALVTSVLMAGGSTSASAQPAASVPAQPAAPALPPAPPPPPLSTWRLSATNVVRVESWRFFEPPPGGGEPDYAFLADRLRLEVRGRLDLASAADLWYAGSGATLARGTVFGYAGRRSNGSRRLGTSVEASADYAIAPRVSVNGFLGHMRGGSVVTGTFADGNLWFGYIESVVVVGTR